MEPFEIFITYISWGSGGKARPVLVLQLTVADKKRLAEFLVKCHGDDE